MRALLSSIAWSCMFVWLPVVIFFSKTDSPSFSQKTGRISSQFSSILLLKVMSGIPNRTAKISVLLQKSCRILARHVKVLDTS